MTEPFKDGDPVVTALIWEVDRAVKQAMRDGGRYDTVIRHILNEHLRAGPADTPLRDAIAEYARDVRRNSSGSDDYPWEMMRGVADYLEVLLQRYPALPAAGPPESTDVYLKGYAAGLNDGAVQAAAAGPAATRGCHSRDVLP